MGGRGTNSTSGTLHALGNPLGGRSSHPVCLFFPSYLSPWFCNPWSCLARLGADTTGKASEKPVSRQIPVGVRGFCLPFLELAALPWCDPNLHPPHRPTPADSENNNAFLVASSSEEKTDLGQVLTEEEVPGSSKELETPEESESDASWTIQMVSEPHGLQPASSLFLHPPLHLKPVPEVIALVPGLVCS